MKKILYVLLMLSSITTYAQLDSQGPFSENIKRIEGRWKYCEESTYNESSLTYVLWVEFLDNECDVHMKIEHGNGKTTYCNVSYVACDDDTISFKVMGRLYSETDGERFNGQLVAYSQHYCIYTLRANGRTVLATEKSFVDKLSSSRSLLGTKSIFTMEYEFYNVEDNW